MMLKEPHAKCVRLGKALICCDSFKGTLTACAAGLAVARGVRRAETAKDFSGAISEIQHCPMSDGGAGLIESICFRPPCRAESLKQSPRFTRVKVPAEYITGPLCEPLDPSTHAVYFACDLSLRIVVIEMAAACGLSLLSEEQKNPLRTTSYGVGQLMLYAMEYVARATKDKRDGAVSVFLGIGGSATNDGGLGALQALGVELRVRNGSAPLQTLSRPFTGEDLPSLKDMRMSEKCRRLFFPKWCEERGLFYCKEIRLICDVTAPLVGPHGATKVFGPQKCNASWDADRRARILHKLECGMLHAAQCVTESLRKDSHQFFCGEKTHRDVETFCSSAGGGGAGGMSGFFREVLQATWMQGTDAVAELLGLREKLQWCDYMITGEGSFDEQSIRYNKTVGRLLQMAVQHNMAQKQEQAYAYPSPSVVKDVLVICGRTSFRDGKEVREALISHMKESYVRAKSFGKPYMDLRADKMDELEMFAPDIHLLSLTPRYFSTADALGNAAFCVEEVIEKYILGQIDEVPRSSQL